MKKNIEKTKKQYHLMWAIIAVICVVSSVIDFIKLICGTFHSNIGIGIYMLCNIIIFITFALREYIEHLEYKNEGE